MDNIKMPAQGEILYLKKDNKPCQIISVALNERNGESMVVYQKLYDDFSTYVTPLTDFLKSIMPPSAHDNKYEAITDDKKPMQPAADKAEEGVSSILLDFLEAKSYSGKLEILTSGIKRLDDRLVSDMAASLDCIVEEGPLEKRIQELINCLKALSRFENRRLR